MTLDQKLRQTANELKRSVSGRRPPPPFHRRNARGPVIALATAAAVLVPVIVISTVVSNGRQPAVSGPASSPIEQPDLTTTPPPPAATTSPTLDDGLSEANLLPPGWDRGLGAEAFLVLAEHGVALAVSDGDQSSGFTTWAMGAQAGRTVVDVAGEIPDTVVWVETVNGNPTATVFGLVDQDTTSVELQIDGVTHLATDRIYQRPKIGRAVFIGSLDPDNLPTSWSVWQITTTSANEVMSVIPLDTPDVLDNSEGVAVSMLLPQGSLVDGAVTVDSLPQAIPCQTGDDIETPPNKGEVFSQPNPHPTPEDALDAFITDTAGQHQLATSRYVELRSSENLIGYGIEFEGGPGYVTVISIDQTDQGWIVVQWEASGC